MIAEPAARDRGRIPASSPESRLVTTRALVCPEPGTDLVPTGWADGVVVPWLKLQTEPAELPTAAACLDGLIAAYRTLGDDAFELVKARRLLEIRWGELLGPGQPGNPTGANQFRGTSHACDDPLTKDDRLRFRQLAANKTRALDYIKRATDADDLSRAAVLRAANATSQPKNRRRTSLPERRTHELAALLGDAKIMSPRRTRDRGGQFQRYRVGEYDWYYQLTAAKRARVRRYLFSPDGLECDVHADRVGLSVDDWASRVLEALESDGYHDPLLEAWDRLAALDAQRIETHEVTTEPDGTMEIGGVRVDWGRSGTVNIEVETLEGATAEVTLWMQDEPSCMPSDPVETCHCDGGPEC